MHLRLPLFAAALTALCLAAPAGAAVNNTIITNPADGSTFTTRDGNPLLTVTGVAPGAADGDDVQVRCYRFLGPDDYHYYTWGEANIVGQSFSLQVDEFRPYVPCWIVAVPLAYPANATTFPGKTGARYIPDNFLLDNTGTGNSTIDFQAGRTIGSRYMAAFGVSSCGVCDAALYDAQTGMGSHHVYWGNVALYRQTEDQERASAQVDGRNVYLPYSTKVLPGPPPGGTATMTASEQQGPDGSWIIRETARMKRCTNTTWPVNTGADCGSLEDVPVELDRTIRQYADRFTVEDVWRSTDGQPHVLDLRYYHATEPEANAAFRPSWTNAPFAELKDGAKLEGIPAGERTLFLDTDTATPNDSFAFPQGAVTFAPAPDSIRFDDSQGYVWEPAYRRTVPGSGSLTITQDLLMARTESEITSLAAKSEDRLGKPTVAIDAPAESVSTARVTVAGAVADNRGVATLTLNGDAVTPGADGRWSREVTLQPGANAFTATVRDAQGNSATASRTVTYTPPVPPPPPTVRDLVAPTISSATLSASTFRVAAGPTAVSAQRRSPAGTTVRFSVSEPSRVTFAISRRTTGRRVGGRCVKTTKRNRRRGRCTRYVLGRTLTRRATAGANQLRFTGRVGTRKLAVGRYRFAIVAIDAAGNRSRPRLLAFRIVRR